MPLRSRVRGPDRSRPSGSDQRRGARRPAGWVCGLSASKIGPAAVLSLNAMAGLIPACATVAASRIHTCRGMRLLHLNTSSTGGYATDCSGNRAMMAKNWIATVVGQTQTVRSTSSARKRGGANQPTPSGTAAQAAERVRMYGCDLIPCALMNWTLGKLGASV